MFFRASIGLIPTLVMLYRPPGIKALRTGKIGAHLLRGAVSVIGTFGFFWAFAVMPLADAYAIGFAAPMFITAMSVPLLGERVGPRRWLAVLVGFIGVLIMVRPGGGGTFGGGGAVALLATAAYALSMVLMRLYSRTETNAAMIFYSTIVIVAVAAGADALHLGDADLGRMPACSPCSACSAASARS